MSIYKMLTADEAMRLAGDGTGFISYDDLMNIKSTKELFKRFNKIILLYLHYKDQNNLVGHYVCLINHPNSIEFADSYGMKVDDILMMKTKRERQDTDQNNNALAKLLYNSGRTIEYSDIPLQSKDIRVTTCGYYAGLRARYSDLPLNDWMKFWKQMKQNHKGKELDKLAVRMSDILLSRG